MRTGLGLRTTGGAEPAAVRVEEAIGAGKGAPAGSTGAAGGVGKRAGTEAATAGGAGT